MTPAAVPCLILLLVAGVPVIVPSVAAGDPSDPGALTRAVVAGAGLAAGLGAYAARRAAGLGSG